MRVVVVSRAPRFSPNSVERDAAILEAVRTALQATGHEVEWLSEEALEEKVLATAEAVVLMARDEVALKMIAAAAQQAKIWLNPPQSLLAATRTFFTRVMTEQGIPQPAYELLQTGSAPTLPFPLWVKRGDGVAQEKGDVVWVDTDEALSAAMTDLQQRSAQEVLAFAHEKGDLVKFYGVAGGGFFYTSYPAEGERYSKFGCEQHNTPLAHTPFSLSELQRCAERLSLTTGIVAYGGDAIVRPNGSFVIIDFNDFPSFSICRVEATQAIVAWIEQQGTNGCQEVQDK